MKTPSLVPRCCSDKVKLLGMTVSITYSCIKNDPQTQWLKTIILYCLSYLLWVEVQAEHTGWFVSALWYLGSCKKTHWPKTSEALFTPHLMARSWLELVARTPTLSLSIWSGLLHNMLTSKDKGPEREREEAGREGQTEGWREGGRQKHTGQNLHCLLWPSFKGHVALLLSPLLGSL